MKVSIVIETTDELTTEQDAMREYLERGLVLTFRDMQSLKEGIIEAVSLGLSPFVQPPYIPPVGS